MVLGLAPSGLMESSSRMRDGESSARSDEGSAEECGEESSEEHTEVSDEGESNKVHYEVDREVSSVVGVMGQVSSMAGGAWRRGAAAPLWAWAHLSVPRRWR